MKKSMMFLMVMVLFSSVFVGCRKEEVTNQPVEEKEVVESTEEANKEVGKMVEFTDMLGRKVQVPAEIKTIATPNVDAYRILVQLGAQDMLVGAPSNMYGSKYSDVDTVEVLAWQEVKVLDKVGGGPPNSEINIEKLIDLKPDVIISWSYGNGEAGIGQADLLQEKSQIPVLCLNSISKTDATMKNVEEAYAMMGSITGEETRAKELVNYYKLEVGKVKKIIDDANVTPARFYMCSPGNILRASNSYIPPKQLGFENVGLEIGIKGGEITKEHLITWNPDYIFMHTPSKVYRVDLEEIKKDPVLKSVSAIQNNQVYHLKSFYMGWDIATGVVDTYIIAKVAYPSLFEDIDMGEKGEEILKEFYQAEGLYESLRVNSDLPSFIE